MNNKNTESSPAATFNKKSKNNNGVKTLLQP